MDTSTIEAYNEAAIHFADEWRNQPPPTDMYELAKQFFRSGGRTADIGCGAGRDVAWLNENGFPSVGYDASTGLLQQAKQTFPHLEFATAFLPSLDGVEADTFDNVLCETVIMHLPSAQVPGACVRLLEILKPEGVLYLSWRVSEGESSRDKKGRLYSAFDGSLVIESLADAIIVLNEETISQSSGKRIRRVIARRPEIYGYAGSL